MKLTYLTLDLELDLSDEMITTLIVEERRVFRKLVKDFFQAGSGEDSEWVLSLANKILDIKKDVYFISDFFKLDINNKTLLSKLHQRLSGIATEEVELLYEINQKIQQLLLSLESSLSIDVFHNELIAVQDIVKLGNFLIRDDEFDDIGKVANFIDVVIELLNPKLVILLNPRAYMEHEEITLFFETMLCKKIPVLCIERVCKDDISVVKNKEIIYTLDKDLCVF
ncbi:type II-A CRISPR-associated protein Csn2 [Veillonella sp. R32]|uniref:type II-A CRISPR-associated protein Csn2 n=1 Tax=Veillonella sp. R32 TaxID=2021312 RepID=UPI00138965BA|nr:type II-A CRISPR-associated protein Csn2 [Veillonella sp. R32]KAF1683854.1 type II-A CRISPR-associated protein Csn2 [Veillonella sp. R32]